MNGYVAIIINSLSACYNWASALFAKFGIPIVALLSVFLGITYTFNFFRGAIK